MTIEEKIDEIMEQNKEMYKIIADPKIYNWATMETINIQGMEMNSIIGELSHESEYYPNYYGLIVVDFPKEFIQWFRETGQDINELENYIIIRNHLAFLVYDLDKELEPMKYSEITLAEIIESFVEYCNINGTYHYYWEQFVSENLGIEIIDYLEAKQEVIAEFRTSGKYKDYIFNKKGEEHNTIIDRLAEDCNYECCDKININWLTEESERLKTELQYHTDSETKDLIELLCELADNYNFKAITNLLQDEDSLATILNYLDEDYLGDKLAQVTILLKTKNLQEVTEIIQ